MQGAVDIIPRLVQCLRRLPGCSASSKYPLRWQTALSALFNSLYKVMCLEHFPEAGRQDISQAVQQLLILAVEGPAPTSSVAETDADMLAGLRGAVCLSHDASAFLPVLPEHAAELLSRLLHKHMAPSKELLLDNSHQLVVLLLAAQLCKGPAKGRGLDPGLAHQMAAVACRLVFMPLALDVLQEQAVSCFGQCWCFPAVYICVKLGACCLHKCGVQSCKLG